MIITPYNWKKIKPISTNPYSTMAEIVRACTKNLANNNKKNNNNRIVYNTKIIIININIKTQIFR